jgi:hypothetical protein
VASLDHLAAARRWVKFPATILFATGVLWLLQIIFNSDWEAIRNYWSTGAGALLVLVYMLVIPLGSVAIALGLLFLQRWALWGGAILPVVPLVLVTIDKFYRIKDKFADFRDSGNSQALGDGVMTSVLVLALWAVYALILVYLYKANKILGGAEQWLKRPVRDATAGAARDPAAGRTAGDFEAAEGDYCQLFPEDTPGMDDDEAELG